MKKFLRSWLANLESGEYPEVKDIPVRRLRAELDRLWSIEAAARAWRVAGPSVQGQAIAGRHLREALDAHDKPSRADQHDKDGQQ